MGLDAGGMTARERGFHGSCSCAVPACSVKGFDTTAMPQRRRALSSRNGWLNDVIVPFCPELAGGLGVLAPPAEIQGEGGRAILNGSRSRGYCQRC